MGSLNVDLVFAAPRRPGAGETLQGTAFDVYTGGKGANQALAAARAGGLVSLVGRTGDDPFGAQLRAALEADGVDLRHTAVDAEAGTGVAGIVVEPDGSNSIVVVSRANGRLGPPDVARAAGAIEEAAVLLLQLETPLRSRRQRRPPGQGRRPDGGAQSGPRAPSRPGPGPGGALGAAALDGHRGAQRDRGRRS